MADTTTELEVLDEIVDTLGGTSGQYDTVVPVLQDILALLGGKGGSGYNPSLSVGRADSLTGADSTSQWATRESTGSGSATVRSVQGAAVAFRQKYNYAKRPSTVTNGIDVVNNNDGSITLSGTATADVMLRWNYNENYIILSGHKYLEKFCPSGGSANTYYTYDSWNGRFNDTGAGSIFTANADTSLQPVLNVMNGATINGTVYPQFFDLTAMFGAGNEPATVAEFERMFPASYYPYSSAATLKPVQISGIASTDAQGNALGSVEWTAQTLRAAGSVADMLYSDHVDVRVGVVDLGTLTWSTYSGSTNHYFRTSAYDWIVAGTNHVISDLACAVYPATAPNNIVDKTINVSTDRRLVIKDDSFNDDADALKASLNGVLCFYALTESNIITTPISPALPMTYRVQQDGSESIIVPEGEISAAPVLTVAEGESASELVMDALACIATPDGPVATANHAVGTYLTMQGKLYKVTSAIAVGESITAGTNVTQTTVMSELLALTA